MEEQKNNQELQEETLQAPVTEEEIPGAEVVVEEPTAAAEETVEQTPVEPVKKATPGKIAVAVGIVILLAALLIALVLGGKGQKTETTENAPAEETAVVETVEATIPADGNPEDVTCKGSYSISDEEVAATADTVVATIGENTLTNRNLQIYYWMEVQNFLNTYGAYAAYFGMDYTQPLDTQRSTYDENLTWQQFFLRNNSGFGIHRGSSWG